MIDCSPASSFSRDLLSLKYNMCRLCSQIIQIEPINRIPPIKWMTLTTAKAVTKAKPHNISKSLKN